MTINAKMLTRVLCKAATKLQRYDFALLAKHIPIMQKFPADFPKSQMIRVLVYLLKHKFHFNGN